MNLILQAIKSMFRNIEQQIAKLYKKTEDLQVLSEIKPDWNQNDETAPDYIKNRTHWIDDPVETVLVEKITIEASDVTEPVIDPFGIQFIEGQSYQVIFDGVEYDCIAHIAPAPMTPSIGNDIVGEAGESDTGEPFFCTVFDGMVMLFANTTGSHTIKISMIQSEIHKLDKKFLPDDLRVQPDWNQNDPEAPDYIENRPFYEGVVRTTYIEEQEIYFEDNGRGDCVATIPDLYLPWDEVPYELTFDGAKYIADFYDNGDSGYINFILENGICIHIDMGGYITINSTVFTGNHTIQLVQVVQSYVPLSKHYLPFDLDDLERRVENKMDAFDPTATGRLSVNRQPDSIIGNSSHAVGLGVIAPNREGIVLGSYNLADDARYSSYISSTVATFTKSYTDSTTQFTYATSYHCDPDTGVLTLTNEISASLEAAPRIWGNIQKAGHTVFMISNGRLYGSQDGDGSKVYRSPGTSRIYFADWHEVVSDLTSRIKQNLLTIGNGTSDTARSNAHTLDWNGLGWFAGGLKVGGASQDDENSVEVALKTDIPNFPTPSIADSGKVLTVQPDGSWGLSPASGAMTVVDDGEGNLTFLNVSVSTQEV